MKDQLVFEDAKQEHVNDIVDIIRDGNKSHIDKIIYGQKGIYNYILDRIQNDKLDSIYKVAIYNDEVVGVIELREIEDKIIFLNYIAVKDSFQNNGIGKYMLRKFINECKKNHKYKEFQLDVFEDNEKAYKWYLKLGLEVFKKSYWVEIKNNKNLKLKSIEDINIITKGYLDNGFDILELDLYNKKYKVGIIGEKWLRLYEIDNKIVEVLSTIKERRIFAIVDNKEKLENEKIKFNKVRKTYRMKIDMEKICI